MECFFKENDGYIQFSIASAVSRALQYGARWSYKIHEAFKDIAYHKKNQVPLNVDSYTSLRPFYMAPHVLAFVLFWKVAKNVLML